MKPHAFVAMPFGVKKDSQDTEIDFNRVYTELTKSGASSWLEVLRADRGDAGLRQSYCIGIVDLTSWVLQSDWMTL